MKPTTIDDYLATVDVEKRNALERLRRIIKAAAPKAEESIGYGMPMFRLNGMLVSFAAAKNHCAFYPCSGSLVKSLSKDLQDFETSKGTIRFQPEKPLPATLVRRIVKIRLKENAARHEFRLRKARKAMGR